MRAWFTLTQSSDLDYPVSTGPIFFFLFQLFYFQWYNAFSTFQKNMHATFYPRLLCFEFQQCLDHMFLKYKWNTPLSVLQNRFLVQPCVKCGNATVSAVDASVCRSPLCVNHRYLHESFCVFAIPDSVKGAASPVAIASTTRSQSAAGAPCASKLSILPPAKGTS